MLRERSYKTVIKRPRCVACARPMRLVRKTLRFAGFRIAGSAPVRVRSIGEIHIEEAPTPDQGHQ